MVAVFIDNDITILATSTENMSGKFSTVFPIDSNLGLFKSKGFAWRHSKKEQSFLREMFEENI